MVYKNDLKIPVILVSRQDLVKVHRELSNFIDAINQSALRHEKTIKYPEISMELKDLSQLNQINLGNSTACSQLLSKLQSLIVSSPTIHVSFPSEPSKEVVDKLVTWFRKEINPHIFMIIGLQPTITAGIILRTTNKQFDFSLRSNLTKEEPTLVEAIKL